MTERDVAAIGTCTARRALHIVALLVALGIGDIRALPAQLVDRGSVAIYDVTVIDATGALPMEHMTVRILGSRIVAVKKTIAGDTTGAGVVIRGTGKYLIPGLNDMHVHLFNHISGRPPNTWYFPLFVVNGVTSVRDMWTRPIDMPVISSWRRDFANGTSLLPRIPAVGTIVDGPPALPGSIVVSNRPEIDDAINRIKAAHVDFVKPYSNLTRAAYLGIIEQSRLTGLPVAGHVPYAVSAEEASNAGQRSMEHLNQILETCSTMSREIMAVPGADWNAMWDERLADTFDAARCHNLIALFAGNETWQVPTLVRQREHYFTGDVRTFTHDKRLKYVPRTEEQRWPTFIRMRESLSKRELQTDARLWKLDREVVAEMARANVPIMTGTDLGNEFLFPGFSVHDELALLVAAGLSPMQALRAATEAPARFLGINKEIGTIEPGKLADLVILNGNPLADIHNTTRIHAVVLNGRVILAREIERVLRDAAHYAERH